MKFILAFAFLFSVTVFADALSLSVSAPNVFSLGTQQKLTVTLTAGNDFQGNSVTLSIDRKTLDAVDPAQDIAVTLPKSTVSISAGQTAQAELDIIASPSAPDFKSGSFSLNAVSNNNTTAQSAVGIQVQPVLEVGLFGGAVPEVWSLPAKVLVRAHDGGVTVHFVNYDTRDTHLIHGQGAIKHAPINKEMAAAHAAGQAGGTYDVLVTATDANLEGDYYCHLHEDDPQLKTIIFNAQ